MNRKEIVKKATALSRERKEQYFYRKKLYHHYDNCPKCKRGKRCAESLRIFEIGCMSPMDRIDYSFFEFFEL